MNEIECETCVKRKTVYCPNHADCYDTINKPYYQNRIMLLEENNQLKEQLQQQNQQYKEVIDRAIKYINDNSWYFNDEDSGAMFCLEEEKAETFCNDLLNILKEVE